MPIKNIYDAAAFLNEFDAPVEIDFSAWNVSEAEYRAYDALNFHKLLDFRRDPRAFNEGYFGVEKEPTDAMRFGTALHARILQGLDVFESSVAVFDPPKNPKTGEAFGATTKAYQEARAAFNVDNVGKTIISVDDADVIERLAENYAFHSIAPSVLSDGFGASEINAKGWLSLGEESVEIKGRFDRYGGFGLVDVKTTSQFDDASGKDRFLYSIYDYKYLIQLGFYHLILTECYGAPFVPCWIVGFERQAPYRVACYALTRDVVTSARNVAREWIAAYSFAVKNEEYKSRYDYLRMIANYNPERDLN